MRTSKWSLFMLLASVVLCSCRPTDAAQQVSETIDRSLGGMASPDRNIRREAIGDLYRLHKQGAIDRASTRISRTALRKYATRWDEKSDKAVLLLGSYGGDSDIPTIRGLMNDAEAITGDMDDRKVLVPRVKAACLKALLKLNDTNAVAEVTALLRADDVASRLQAVECVAFAQSNELIPETLALLQDSRDAVNISPSGGKYYLRICDVALNAVASISKVDVSFTVRNGERYGEQMINEFQTNVNAWLAKQAE
jgi:hypothetical protein